MSAKTTWVNGDPLDRRDPFNGLLIVFNLGEKQVSRVPQEFTQRVAEAISDAYADGCLVVYLFEPGMGGELSDALGRAEGMDTTWFWSTAINLPLDPEKKKAALVAIAQHVSENSEKSGRFEFGGKKAVFCGLVRIDGVAVLMPPTDVTV